MGVPTSIECVSCRTMRPAAGVSPVDLLDSNHLVSLSMARLSNVVCAGDLASLVQQHSVSAHGLSAQQAVRQYAASSGGSAPPEDTFRSVLQAEIAAESTALPMLSGSALPCDCCGTSPHTVGLDADMSAVRMDTSGGNHDDVALPGGVVLPDAVAASVEAAAATSAPAPQTASNCGDAQWRAASVKGGGTKRRPLAFTGVGVLACTHLCVFWAMLLTRGEVYAMHIFGAIVAALLTSKILSHDIACLVLRHIMAQNAIDPAFADPILAATMEPGGLLSARLLPGPLGRGAAPLLRISLQADATRQAAAMALQEKAEDAAIDMLPEAARPAARAAQALGVRLVPAPHPPPLVMPPAPAGYNGLLRLLQDAVKARGGVLSDVQPVVPVLHAKAHGCEASLGATNVKGAGWRGEFNEQLFAMLTKFAPYLQSLGHTQFRVALESFFALNNRRRNVNAAERLLKDYVRLLLRSQQQKAAADEVRRTYACAFGDSEDPSDATVAAWAAAASRAADKVPADGSAPPDPDRLTRIRAIARVDGRRHALAAAVSLATAAAASRRRATDAAAAAGEAAFTAAVVADDGLRAYIARPPAAGEAAVTDVASARARIDVLENKLVKMRAALAGSDFDPDSIVAELMNRAHALASSLSQLTPSVVLPMARCELSRCATSRA